MQKLKKSKKGFTLTELAIVIAVIAILVAVLVPTFIVLIDKANESSDQQTVKNLNTALSIDEAGGQKPETLCAVWEILEEANYNPAPTPNYSDNEFYWCKTDNVIVINSISDGKITFPADYEGVEIATLDVIKLDTSEDSKEAHASDFEADGCCSHCRYASYAYMVESKIITVDSTNTYILTAVSSAVEELVIPEGITQIGAVNYNPSASIVSSNSSTPNTTLKSITIPEGVTSLENGVFMYCTALEEIVIPDSVTGVGMGAFLGCSSLKSVTIGSGITTLTASTFKDCTSLEEITIPGNVTQVSMQSFNGCTSLKTVTIGDGVGYIDITRS